VNASLLPTRIIPWRRLSLDAHIRWPSPEQTRQYPSRWEFSPFLRGMRMKSHLPPIRSLSPMGNRLRALVPCTPLHGCPGHFFFSFFFFILSCKPRLVPRKFRHFFPVAFSIGKNFHPGDSILVDDCPSTRCSFLYEPLLPFLPPTIFSSFLTFFLTAFFPLNASTVTAPIFLSSVLVYCQLASFPRLCLDVVY